MADKTHILVISQYFYPEQFRINDIVSELVNRGYKVTVLTGIPNYPQGRFYNGYGYFKKRKENYNGAEIIRIPIIPRGHSSVMMALNYLSFVVSGYLWSKFTTLKADKVFIYEVSPMTQAFPGVWYAKRRNIHSILYVTDLWPENVQYAGGINNPVILGWIGRMVDYIYKKTDLILTSSKSFVSAIKARGVPEHKIKFWPQYAEEWYVPIEQAKINLPSIPQDGKLNLLFAGNIGKAQGLEVLPLTAEILKDNNAAVRFNIVGDGRFKETLEQIIKDKNVSDYFNFIDRQPAAKIPEYMSVCDAALITLAKSEIFSMTLPAKLPSCLACGVPVIVCADGEIQQVIQEANAGFCCSAGDYKALADIIMQISSMPKRTLDEIGENARKYFESHFEKEKLLDDFEADLMKAGNNYVRA